MEPVFQAVGINEPPEKVNTVVIVGNKISPGTIHKKSEGTQVRTLWGEIAWQLGGSEGYKMVQEADQSATNPGDILKDLFNRYAPCLILIDEWVAYARQLHERSDLSSGSFETHFTFAQTLSESAKNADRTLLVVSIPSSDIEIGGDRGKDALEHLKNAIGRVESPWRPASAEESFEIVRRRLFQTTTDPLLFVARDAVIKAFSQMYHNQRQEFSTECNEADYERRLREAYPIHPEFFDRSLLIMPAHIPMDDPQVQSELTRYLDDNWVPILEKDVDGANFFPLEIDRTNPNFGRYSACRRVTRTIYLGSAPIIRASTRGLEDRRIKLGCVQPGENVATFGDALRRLTDRATYLYVDGNRYWISNQPNVTRTAQDRATQFLEEQYKISDEIIRRLKEDKQKGEFSAVHIAPESTADIPDDPNLGVRIIVLKPQDTHKKSLQDNPARQVIEDILHHRGSSQRYYKNTLVFLAPDKGNLETLSQNVAQYLAWNSIVTDEVTINLDVSQTQQATTKRNESNKNVNKILNETYQWLLVPTQSDSQKGIEWIETRLQGNDDSPILRSSRKLVNDHQLILKYSPGELRLEVLDLYLWRETNHINLKKFYSYLTQYLYLPRLKDSAVLLQTIKDGLKSTVVQDNFGYAEGWDEVAQRYVNLVVLTDITPTISEHTFLVKSEIALAQLEREKPAASALLPHPSGRRIGGGASQDTGDKPEPAEAKLLQKTWRRFHGNIKIDTVRLTRDVDKISQEIIQHLNLLKGVNVDITLEIEASIPEGVPEDVVRTLTENCNTLKFKSHSFEQD